MSTPISSPRNDASSQVPEVKSKKRGRKEDEPSLEVRIAQLRENLGMLEYTRSANPVKFNLAEIETVGIGMGDILENFNKIDRAASPENEELFQKMDNILKQLGIVSNPVSSREDLKKAKNAKDQEFESWPEEGKAEAASLQPTDYSSIAEETKRTVLAFQRKALEAKIRDTEMNGLINDAKTSAEELENISKKMQAVTYGSPENQIALMQEIKRSLERVLTDLERLSENISSFPRDVRVTAKYSSRLEKHTGAILEHLSFLKHSLKIFKDLESFDDEGINKRIQSTEEGFRKIDKNADLLQVETRLSPRTPETPLTVSSLTASESKGHVEEDSDASSLARLLDAQAEKDREMQKLLVDLKELMRQSSLMQAKTKHLFESTDASIEVRNYLNRIIKADKEFEGLQSLYPDYETEYDANIDKILDDLEPVLTGMRNRLKDFRKEGKTNEDLEALLNSLLGPE